MGLVGSAGVDFVVTRDTETVTVLQIDPDTGITLTSATGVSALRQALDTETVGAGGGELSAKTVRWTFPLYQVSAWTVKQRDQVVDSGGVIWYVQGVTLDPSGALYDVVAGLKR